MKRYILLAIMAIAGLTTTQAQTIASLEGHCGEGVKWQYDGFTLTLSNDDKENKARPMENYDTDRNLAPWTKKKLSPKKVVVGAGITTIGSCAFANCQTLTEVIFQGTSLKTIGWGAFLGCSRLRVLSLPVQLGSIETIAFANCTSLPSIKLPDKCRVGDQAFASCINLKTIEVSPTTILGHYVFASEVETPNGIRHALYNGEIIRLPSYINASNSNEYGLAGDVVEHFSTNRVEEVDYDYATSEVDSDIPFGDYSRANCYALIIGNQNYRFVSNVPYAIHDARVFGEYCKKTLGIPVENVHVVEDATKQMILEEELEDWVSKITDRQEKSLIVYYAGHGTPDTKDGNKAYLLPTDVRGTNPKRGISLDSFYEKLGDLAFAQTSVFLDACFSGVNRESNGVVDGLRAPEIEAEAGKLSNGSVVVFSAAQGNETAQGYPEQGHGLFTYYLLKEIQDSYGNIDYGELSDHINEGVRTKAKSLKLNKPQTPTTNASEQVADTWRSMQF